jgi:glycosyltransferase involved in cell wall biosynthesis
MEFPSERNQLTPDTTADVEVLSGRPARLVAMTARDAVGSLGPSLTVVIPVWGARYLSTLPRAIASVRAQDPELPIVVVDNAAEGGLPATGNAVVIRAEDRLSAGAARNLGLERVEREAVVFLDADDELAPGAVALMRRGLAANPDASVYALSVLEADSGARHAFPHRFAPRLARRSRLFAFATAVWSLYPVHGSAAIRTSAVREAGGQADCTGGEDWALAVSLAFRGRVVFDSAPGLIYHRHPESLLPRTRGTGDVLAAARRVRGRLRTDPAVPRWVRLALPAIASFQWLLIVAVRPLYRAVYAAIVSTRRGRSAA